MLLLTFYAVLRPRGKRVPVGSIDHYPDDWIELRTMLEEAAKKIYIEHDQVESAIFLERHLPGKFFVGFAPGSYVQEKVRYKRGKEAFFRVWYNPKFDSVEKVQAVFSYNLMHLLWDYQLLEKGRLPRSPPLISKEHLRVLEDPRAILKEHSGARYADYSRTPRMLYGYGDERHPRPMDYERLAKLEYERRRR